VHRDSIVFKDVQHNLAILSDVVIEDDTFRIFNAHLQSIYLGPEEYRGMQHLRKRSEVEFLLLRIIGKMYKAFMKRATQAEILAGEIAKSPYKALVAGDFNDTPNSYTYRTISRGLCDSFKEAGCLIGRTYSKPAIFRIDFILGDPRIHFKSHKVIWNNESDHYAVKATFDKE
jgi:endonuclease/exonuclease/phosphatase family metal-dependent hydrolase